MRADILRCHATRSRLADIIIIRYYSNRITVRSWYPHVAEYVHGFGAMSTRGHVEDVVCEPSLKFLQRQPSVNKPTVESSSRELVRVLEVIHVTSKHDAELVLVFRLSLGCFRQVIVNFRCIVAITHTTRKAVSVYT